MFVGLANPLTEAGTPIFRSLSLRAFGLSGDEASFGRRGFHCVDPTVREKLEDIGRTFIRGYNQALAVSEIEALAGRLDVAQVELRGFAFEGAGMALALLDNITPWNTTRVYRFLRGPGARHSYMVHIGIGWTIGRLPWLRRRLNRCLSRLDPLLGWLVVDGYGFHEGYFHWHEQIQAQKYPIGLSQYARRVFDQGLGRSLWFVDGADADRIRKTIASFPANRQADLWSGVGLASAYAGSVCKSSLESLKQACAGFRPQLAQGAAFAAKARQVAGNPAKHTDLACRIFTGLNADECANVTDVAMVDLPRDSKTQPRYEIWRLRIQSYFSTEVISA
jgi:hypothetical protein